MKNLVIDVKFEPSEDEFKSIQKKAYDLEQEGFTVELIGGRPNDRG